MHILYHVCELLINIIPTIAEFSLFILFYFNQVQILLWNHRYIQPQYSY